MIIIIVDLTFFRHMIVCLSDKKQTSIKRMDTILYLYNILAFDVFDLCNKKVTESLKFILCKCYCMHNIYYIIMH